MSKYNVLTFTVLVSGNNAIFSVPYVIGVCNRGVVNKHGSGQISIAKLLNLIMNFLVFFLFSDACIAPHACIINGTHYHEVYIHVNGKKGNFS